MNKKNFEELNKEENAAFTYTIEGIRWDTTDDDPEEDYIELGVLPENVILKTSSEEDNIIDELSDHYGFCIFGVENIEVSKNTKDKKKKRNFS